MAVLDVAEGGVGKGTTTQRTEGPPLVLNSEMAVFGTHMHVVVLRNGPCPLGPLGKATATAQPLSICCLYALLAGLMR